MGHWDAKSWVCAASALLGFAPGAAALELQFVTMHFPPYVEQEQGAPRGSLVRLLQGVCGQLRWNCRVTVLPWRRAQGEIERGEADGAFPLLATAPRRLIYHLSLPVVDIQYAFFSRLEQSFSYQNGVPLGTRQIGVFGPSGTATALQELVAGQASTVVIEPDNITVLRKLLAGRYGHDGLAFINRDVAWQLSFEQGLLGLREAGVGREATYVFGLSRQRVNEAQFRAFETALAQLCRSGAAATLLEPKLVPSQACQGLRAGAANPQAQGAMR